MLKSSAGTDYAGMLTNIRQEIADRQLVLSGIFDDKLEAIKAAETSLREAQSIADTLAAAQRVKAEADAYAVATRGAADAKNASAADALARANDKMAAALEKEKNVDYKEEQALGLMADYHAKADSFDADCAKREAAIAAREAALSAAQEELRQQQAAWTDRQKKMAAALEAAKVMAGSA